MTRAALVACALAAAAAVPLSAAAGGPWHTAPPSTFVLRGLVVQYIPPSGSVVGSLSIRVTNVGNRGRMLLGELVTVAVDARVGSRASHVLARQSLLTVTLRATSPGSILKGAATVRTIVAGGASHGEPGDGSTSAGAKPNSSDGAAPSESRGNSSAKSQSGSGDGGDAGDHGSGHSGDGGSGGGGHGSGQGPSGSGSSNGHK